MGDKEKFMELVWKEILKKSSYYMKANKYLKLLGFEQEGFDLNKIVYIRKQL